MNRAKELLFLQEYHKAVLIAKASYGGNLQEVNDSLQIYQNACFPWVERDRQNASKALVKEWADIVSGKIKVIEEW